MTYLKQFCPACAGHVEFPEDGIGTVIDCPHCRASFLLCRQEPMPPEPQKIEDEFSELQTSDGKIFGKFTKSPNGEFMLLWKDEWASGRVDVKGSYYLFYNDREICKGRIERPDNGLVANNGNFIFCDCLFTQDLESVFYAFNVRGEAIIAQKLDANLFSASLSEDGSYAACQTCENKEAISDQTLFAFDLNSGKMIWHTRPPFWPETYEFNLQKLEMTVRGVSPIYRCCILSLIPPPPKKRKASRQK